MAEPSTLDSILNFLIPIFVIGFLLWIIYRIPIVTQMCSWIGLKITEMRERREHGQGYNPKVQTITYE